MKNLKSILGPMRVPFLVLTPACVLLGLGTAIWTSGHINWFHFALVLIGAVSAHISVNAFNEYFDFKSGLDAKTKRTPFSGGSGTLPAQPEMERTTLITAMLSFAVTASVGLFFLSEIGIGLLPLGILGLVIIFIYTNWITRIPFLCLIAPGLGFGPFMVMGTHFVLTGQYSWTAFIASLVPFFLVSDLLLLNQFPDAEADQSVGRKHYPITIGRKKSVRIYITFLLLAYVALGLGVLTGYLPPASLIGLLTLVIVIPITKGVLKNNEDIENLIPQMGQNVIVNIVTPVLVAVGLFFG
ncbi:MAG: prenyltransferase [Chloroflexota bacterium]|nr:prenyltransferase [Chloroflexota bacterium]